MKDHEKTRELLPFYLTKQLDPEQLQRVENHLATCRDCREEMGFWQRTSTAVVDLNRELPLPQQPLLEALAVIEKQGPQPDLWRSFFALLQAQLLLVRREIWTATLLVFIIGFVASILLETSGLLRAIAPLIAAAGVAMLYGKDNDPAYELTLATPVSQAQILLARLVLVFGYDLLLLLIGFASIILLTPEPVVTSLLIDWLAPMTFLSSLALLLSLLFGSTNAISVAYGLWLMQYIVRLPEISLLNFSVFGRYGQLWETPALLFILSGAFVVLALLTVQRRQPQLRT